MSKSDIENKKILDVGCGYGWFERYALKHKAEHVCGVEISDTDLAIARKHVNTPQAEFKVGSGVQIPYDNGAFDTVVSWEVIEHIPESAEPLMFAEVARVLKKDGTFYLSTPYDSFWSKTLDPAFFLIGHRHYSLEQLKEFAELTGFTLETWTVKGRWWELFTILNLYFSKWVLRRGVLFEKFFESRRNKEYQQEKGFAIIFTKFRKVA